MKLLFIMIYFKQKKNLMHLATTIFTTLFSEHQLIFVQQHTFVNILENSLWIRGLDVL